MHQRWSVVISALSLIAAMAQASAKSDETGVTATAITLGQTMPYSGPASAYAVIGRVEEAFFKRLNEQGGINGRKIRLISLDDGYSPPKTVEQTRRLVESEGILLDFNPLGTANNIAIRKYLNAKKVPQLFVASGASAWGDPQHFPYTIGFAPSYRIEATIYAQYLLQNVKGPKVAILYQDDDFGKDYLSGFKAGLGDRAKDIVIKEISYETTDATVDSQVITAQGSGANVFLNIATPKFAAQAIRKVYDVGWKPTHIMTNVSISLSSVLSPAGFDKSIGIISARYLKDVYDPELANDQGVTEFLSFMKSYAPDLDPQDVNTLYAYSVAQALVQVLRQCGDEVTRDNVMKQTAHLVDLELPLLIPGIRVNTSSEHFFPLDQEQLIQFDGKRWKGIGEILRGS